VISLRTAPRRHLGLVAAIAVLALLLPIAAGAQVIPDEVPDRLILLSEPVARGELIRENAPPRLPTPKTVDGDIADWVGEPSRIGGTSRYDAGEHIYSDFLYDAYGADDGDDAQRLALLMPLAEAESRTSRLDQLFQAAGDQFGAPRPAGAPDHYGDVDLRRVADLHEVRWAAEEDALLLLARTTSLTDPSALGLLVLADTRDQPETLGVGFGTDLTSERHDVAVLLTDGEVRVRDLLTGEEHIATRSSVVNAEGWTNALEAALPAALLTAGDELQVAVMAGTMEDGAFLPGNVAYRDDEVVAGMVNDRGQALALHAGNVDRYTTTIDVAGLRTGRSEAVRPGPGYHERIFTSGENISTEDPEQGILQRYGLYVPTAHRPGAASPATFWLHYRGGKSHSAAAWSPRIITQHGEERDNIVVSPHARGTSTWYEGDAHQDFFEVFDDVHDTFEIDPRRRYLSGYSMGGYGTVLFGLLYPDLFAAGYIQAGAVSATQRDVLENARHFPIAIHHGTNDQLVPITGLQQMALRMRELGYRYDMTTFLGYEHYTQAIVDEWADGTAYLDRFATPTAPRQVTYKVSPQLVRAINTSRGGRGDGTFDFDPDGAWWLDGITPRSDDAAALVDAVAQALPDTEPGLLAVAGAASPGAHSTPFMRHGQDWVAGPQATLRNGFSATATGAAAFALDAVAMGLQLGEPVEGSVSLDGATRLTMTGLDRPVRVLVNGEEAPDAFRGQHLVLDLPAGEHELRLVPLGRS
jgi:predicted esterase